MGALNLNALILRCRRPLCPLEARAAREGARHGKSRWSNRTSNTRPERFARVARTRCNCSKSRRGSAPQGLQPGNHLIGRKPVWTWRAVMLWRTGIYPLRHGWHHWRQKRRNPLRPCIMGSTTLRKRINALLCRRPVPSASTCGMPVVQKTSVTTVPNENLATNQSGNSNAPIKADRRQLPGIVVRTINRSPFSERRHSSRGRPDRL